VTTFPITASAAVMRSRAVALVSALALALVALAVLAAAAGAAQAPWWHVDAIAFPTNLPPEGEGEPGEEGEGEIEVIATNLGDAYVEAGELVTVSDTLPKQLKVTAISGKTTRKFISKAEEEMQGDCVEPKGLTPEQRKKEEEEKVAKVDEKVSKGEPIQCTYKHNRLAPYEGLLVKLKVKVEEPEGTVIELPNLAEASGGGAASAGSYGRAFRVDGAPTPFGVHRFELTPEEEGGALASLAGSHPFQLTSHLDFNLTRENWPVKGFLPSLPALPRDLTFKLPPGFLGNPTATPRCSEAQFSAIHEFTNLCPANTVLGAAVVHVNEPHSLNDQTLSVPVFNLTPARGEPARFGFFAAHVVVFVQTAVRSGEEYAATATVRNATETAEVLSTIVTFWGNPGNEVHHDSRGWQCIEGEEHDITEIPGAHCESFEESGEFQPETPFLIMPTTCTGEPINTTLEGVSWPTTKSPEGIPIAPMESEAALVEEVTGCGGLEFDPKLGIEPDTKEASTPTGLTTNVAIPQEGTLSESGRAPSAVKSTTVILPDGVLLNPGAADGLGVCSGGQIGVKGPEFEPEPVITENKGFTEGTPTCPDPAKVGTVRIKTPLLDHEISGSAYLGEQDTNPFAPPLVLYIVVNDEADGILVKLAGSVEPNQNPEAGPIGQLRSTFKETPQLPFESLKLQFFGEGRASTSTPAFCGTYRTKATFVPWSGTEPVEYETFPADGEHPGFEDFSITSGPGGSACTPQGGQLPFAPSATAGPIKGPSNDAAQLDAGHYTEFSVTIKVPDGSKPLKGLTMTLPSGVAAKLASIEPCSEEAVKADACPPASEVGETTAVAGLGSQPVTIKGKLFLTVGYNGEPFGLLAVTHAVVGPFNLGDIPVRSTIHVDENTAAVTINTTDPIPEFIKGAPAQLKELNVVVNRKEFQFNPTNCSPLPITGTFSAYPEGTSPFTTTMQVNNCPNLSFNPGFEAEAEGKGSKVNGTGFKVITTSGGIGVANIHRVHVALPVQLPSRLTTIQKACLLKVFNENPASCPEGSNIGAAHIETPVLKKPLAGPAYLVSHGNEAFPDVEFVLQGEGIKLILDGKTDIKSAQGKPCGGPVPCITFSTFEATPDAPFTRFETFFPPGPHSIVTANVAESKHFNLCGEKLDMPTEITSQSGVLIKETTHVKVTGCPKVVVKKKTKLQLALAKCKKQFKHNKKKRVACERKARKKYAKKAPHKASHKAALHR
jgi:hypothetical protein